MRMRHYISTGLLTAVLCMSFPAQGSAQKFRHVESMEAVTEAISETEEITEIADSLRIRDTHEIIASLPEFSYSGNMSTVNAPLVFVSYASRGALKAPEWKPDTTAFTLWSNKNHLTVEPYKAPWLQEALLRYNVIRGLRASMITYHPESISYLFSELPVPPTLMAAPETFSPDVVNIVPEATDFYAQEGLMKVSPTNWLHVLNMNLQFSQAYLSPNWYQGGNNSLTVLASFLWNVQLNPVYYPNLLFESNLQYKLGLYSTPTDNYHKYAISEDNLQWNAKVGIKAFRKKWFYSFTVQFKTPMMHNYEQNGPLRTSSFLSPGDLNLGIGLSYNTSNPKRHVTFSASLAPLSYNLKTCIDPKVDPAQYNISPGSKSVSEIGSSGELTMTWNITDNISYNTRLFLFSDYRYFLGDWENTFSFNINRFLSTQIYVHGRFDSSSISSDKWKHWMLKEIFSFGFTYRFSTKPEANK